MNYMKPEIEIVEFETVDVIQTSNGGDGENGEEGGYRDNELPLN